MNNNKLWIAIAAGAGIGIAVVLGTRAQKRNSWNHWDTREMSKRIANHKDDLLDRGRDMMDRLRVIYEEGRKVVEDAGELWEEGRKLVGA